MLDFLKMQINVAAISVFSLSALCLIAVLFKVHSYDDFMSLLSFKYADPRSAPFDKDSYSFLHLIFAMFFFSFTLAVNGTWVKWDSLWIRGVLTVTFSLFCVLFFLGWLNGLKPAA